MGGIALTIVTSQERSEGSRPFLLSSLRERFVGKAGITGPLLILVFHRLGIAGADLEEDLLQRSARHLQTVYVNSENTA